MSKKKLLVYSVILIIGVVGLISAIGEVNAKRKGPKIIPPGKTTPGQCTVYQAPEGCHWEGIRDYPRCEATLVCDTN